MSFGFSIGDFVVLTQLAYTVVQNSRKACGAHDELTREVTSLHIVLQRLQREVEKPNSLINRTDDGRLEELQTIVRGCGRMLKVIDQVLVKYNGMLEEKRRVTRFRLKVKFGNGEMKDIGKIRQELATYTSAITLFLNLLTMGSQGKVEEYMESHGEELRELRQSLNWITATLQAGSGNREGSILTTYADDDKAIWKEFRRELLKEGFSSDELRKNKGIIKKYVVELGARGALDAPEFEEPSVEVQNPVEESLDAGKSDELEREHTSVIESTSPRSESPDSSSYREVSTVRPENRIDQDDQPVKNTPQVLGSLMQPTDLFHSSQSSTNLPQMTTFPITGELGQAIENEQRGLDPSISISLKSRNSGPPALQSAQTSDFDGSDSEAGKEYLDELTDTVQKAQVAAQINIAIKSCEDVADFLPSITKTKLTPKPVSIEEVEDEDFRPGAHPNCGERETMIDEYDDLTFSDDRTTGSSNYEDEDYENDEEDTFSSNLSPDDWRNTPAPLWKEVERTKRFTPSVVVDDFGLQRSGNDSNQILNNKAQPPFIKPPYLSYNRLRFTTKDIVEQFGFDPFDNNQRKTLGLSDSAQQGDDNTTTASLKSDSSHTSDSVSYNPKRSSTNAGKTIALTASALQHIPEDPERLLYQSKATLSTRELLPETKGRTRRGSRYLNQDSESEEDLSQRDLPVDHRRIGTAGYRAVQVHPAALHDRPKRYRRVHSADGSWQVVNDNGGGLCYTGGPPDIRRAFSPRYNSTGYYATTAPERRPEPEEDARYYNEPAEIERPPNEDHNLDYGYLGGGREYYA